MLSKLAIYLEMIKFSHTIFALPFALLSTALAFQAIGTLRWLDLVGILCCMVFARSAAMGFNRWADREFDARNPRTQIRAIPAGQMTAGQVLAFVILCSLGFIASCGIFVISSGNWLPLILSVSCLAFLCGYSFAKRFTMFAHVWLGAALAFSPTAAWIAIVGNVTLVPLLLSAAVLCWVAGFDIIYACQDIEIDRKEQLFSIPAKLGFAGSMWVARLFHVLMLGSLVGLGLVEPHLGLFFWCGVAAVAGLLIYEHWLVRGRDLLRINIAFLQVNGIISMGLLLVTLADLARHTIWPQGL